MAQSRRPGYAIPPQEHAPLYRKSDKVLKTLRIKEFRAVAKVIDDIDAEMAAGVDSDEILIKHGRKLEDSAPYLFRFREAALLCGDIGRQCLTQKDHGFVIHRDYHQLMEFVSNCLNAHFSLLHRCSMF